MQQTPISVCFLELRIYQSLVDRRLLFYLCYYSDPEKKRKIQDRLQREQTKLNSVKGQKERAEDMSYQKILKKSQRVLQDVEGEVGAANVLVSYYSNTSVYVFIIILISTQNKVIEQQ